MLILITTNVLETYSFTFITNIPLFKVLQFSNFFTWGNSPYSGPGRRIFEVSRRHSRHTTISRTSPDEELVGFRKFYLTTHFM